MESQENEKAKKFVEPSKQPVRGDEQVPGSPGAETDDPEHEDLELSEAWRELLGLQSAEGDALQVLPGMDAPVPTLDSDPWSTLVHDKGVEVVDLQRVHLNTMHAPLSDQDVDQALQFLQDKPANDSKDKK